MEEGGRRGAGSEASNLAPLIPGRAAGLGAAALVALVAGGFLLTFIFIPEVSHLSGDELAASIEAMGVWGYLAVVGLMILHSFIPFPAEIVALAAGVCFGVAEGLLSVWIGAMIGALLAFGLARRLGRPFVLRFVSASKLEKMDRWCDDHGAGTLILVRLIPVIAFNLINYSAGLTRVGWVTFTWTTALGILPLTLLMVIMGQEMRDPEWTDLLLLALAGLGIWLLVLLARRIRPGRAE